MNFPPAYQKSKVASLQKLDVLQVHLRNAVCYILDKMVIMNLYGYHSYCLK